MARKRRNLELKIYELMGIKIFKKLILKIGFLLALIPSYVEVRDKEEAIEFANNHAIINYTLGKCANLEKIKNFKKMLFLNASIYLVKLIISLELLLKLGSVSILLYITCLYGIIKNAYCLILQRYNQIRINEVLEKGKSLEVKRKNNLKEELLKDKKLATDNRREKIPETDYNNYLDNMSYEELKDLKNYLENLKEKENTHNIPVIPSKPLTLELRR